MSDLSSGGVLAAYDRLMYARSIHAEAQARYAACSWCEQNFADLQSAESKLIDAVDAYIRANGGNPTAPRKAAF